MFRPTQRAASPLLVIFIILAAATLPPAQAATLVVVGQDDVAVDRAAIQAAIDAALPGDTVELRGSFQLDGVSIRLQLSDLTLAGQALDNDGDGATNEDPADGVDDDNDGLVDEDDWDTVLRGVDDGGGGPAGDAFPDRFNDGIEILGFDGELSGIEIRNIRFTSLNRTVYLFPDYDDAGTVFVCDSSVPTTGELEDVEIHDNAFDNNNRGVELLGRVDDVKIADNRFSDISAQAVVMFGEGIGCAEADGSVVEIRPLEIPEDVKIDGNRVEGGFIGVLSQVTTDTKLTCNRFDGPVLGLVSLEDEDLEASGNELDGTFIGLLGSFETRVEGPASDNKFKDNSLTDNVFGVIIDCDTTGYKMSGNSFAGSAAADILLDGTSPGGFCGDAGLGDSFENTAIVDSTTSVFDFGVDNRVIVDDDSDSESDCDDD